MLPFFFLLEEGFFRFVLTLFGFWVFGAELGGLGVLGVLGVMVVAVLCVLGILGKLGNIPIWVFLGEVLGSDVIVIGGGGVIWVWVIIR